MKKLLLGLAAAGTALAMVPLFAAFEAHVINVTARIENALNVPIQELTFGTVFPQEMLDREFDVRLSDSFLEQANPTGNLILNGGFETPDVPTGGWAIYPDASLTSWTVESGAGLEIQDHAAGDPHGGNQLAELDSNNSSVISQTVSTVGGRSYQLRFWYSPRPNRPAGDNTIGAIVQVVSNNSLLVNDIIGAAAAGGSNTSWSEYVYNFVAVDGSTKIKFSDMGTNNSYGGYLDDISLVGSGRVSTVNYVIRQKPKCVDNENSDVHPQVGEDGQGNFVCPDGSTIMPLLCPYLSKHEVSSDGIVSENDGPGINAFHGDPNNWTMATTLATQVSGELSALVQDIADRWNIDLKVPCFEGQCAQDWDAFVLSAQGDMDDKSSPDLYKPNGNLEHEIFGCDLWLEVTSLTDED